MRCSKLGEEQFTTDVQRSRYDTVKQLSCSTMPNVSALSHPPRIHTTLLLLRMVLCGSLVVWLFGCSAMLPRELFSIYGNVCRSFHCSARLKLATVLHSMCDAAALPK